MGAICKAIILCGGKGTRLRPVTYEIPKPLIPVHGKPVVEYIIELLARYGVTDIVLSVGYLKEKIKAHFGEGKFGVSISYVEEDQPLGTAGPLLLVCPESTFAVSNGDELKDINIDKMLAQHKKTSAMVTIALTRVADPSAYGVARMDGTRITEFVEKPPAGQAPSNLINSGFYLMEPEVLKLIPPGLAMLEKDVFPKVAQAGRLYGFEFSGQWFDTGNFERYEKAILEWKGLKQG